MSASNIFLFPRQPLKRAEFLSNGSWTVPKSVTNIIIMGCGGGQAGGLPPGSLGVPYHPGGCGAMLVIYPLVVSEGQVYTITVGAGGNIATSTGQPGGLSQVTGPGGTVDMPGASSGINCGALGGYRLMGSDTYFFANGQSQNGYHGGSGTGDWSLSSSGGGGGAGPFGHGGAAVTGNATIAPAVAGNSGAGGGANPDSIFKSASGGSGRVIIFYTENNLV